jgi:hypothetical protein
MPAFELRAVDGVSLTGLDGVCVICGAAVRAFIMGPFFPPFFPTYPE